MWADASPSELRQVWGEALADFIGADLREALLAMIAHYQEYPPSLPQFRDLCNQARRRRIGYQPRVAAPSGDVDPAVLERIKQRPVGGAPDKKDGRDWARKILADETGKLYPHISYVMAREALGIKLEPAAA